MKNSLLLLLVVLIISCRNDNTINDDQAINPIQIELKTNNPSFISQIQVDFEGEIIKTNDEEIVYYGMLIGKNENLTIDLNEGNQTKEYTTGDRIFKGSFYDLTGDKKYYLKFYVKTKNKIYYGNTVNFISKKHTSPSEQRIYLNTQQQVDDFGKNNYTYVYELNIGGSVENLSPLTSIIKIGGNLNIEYTSKLTSLHGLENLQLIGTDQIPNGQLQIYNNTKLSTLSGLDKLMFTGKLYVGYNPLVKNLQGLGNLEQAWHRTYLTVPSFDGLPLNFRTGEFTSIGFEGTDLGNRSINCEAYDFTLRDAPNITNLKGFTIGNYQNTTVFTLENCKNLKTLEGINFSTNKYDHIQIINCENMENLKGFENLITVNGFTVKNSPKLSSLNGLGNLSKIENALYLDNVSITDLTELKKIQKIKTLNLLNCKNLLNLNGIKGSSIAYLELARCNLIKSLEGFENINNLERIFIVYNNSLQNYCALKSSLASIIHFEIYGNFFNPTKQEIINNCP